MSAYPLERLCTRAEFREKAAGGRWALVLGGGGAPGFAWTAGAVETMRDYLGVEPAGARRILGVSAGGVYGALLSLGLDPAMIGRAMALQSLPDDPNIPFDLDAFRRELRWPRFHRKALREFVHGIGHIRDVPARAILSRMLPEGQGSLKSVEQMLSQACGPGRTWSDGDALRLMTLDASNLQPALLANPNVSSPDDPEPGEDTAHQHIPYVSRKLALPLAACASSAAPALLHPVTEGAVTYVDGGTISSTCAHVVGLDRCWQPESEPNAIVVVAPMTAADNADWTPAKSLNRVLRWNESAKLRKEVEGLSSKYGADVPIVVLAPSSVDADLIGANLLNGSRNPEIYSAARHTAQQQLLHQLPHDSTGSARIRP